MARITNYPGAVDQPSGRKVRPAALWCSGALPIDQISRRLRYIILSLSSGWAHLA